MKTSPENTTSLIICVLEIVVGILLLVNPIGFTTGIIIALGVAMIFVGVVQCIRYFRTYAVAAAVGHGLFLGLCLVLAGIFCVVKSDWFISTFPILTILYGIGILLSGLRKVQWTADLLRLKNSKWYLPAISAVVSIACALVILFNPFTSTVALWMVTGVTLIVEAVLDAVAMILSR